MKQNRLQTDTLLSRNTTGVSLLCTESFQQYVSKYCYAYSHYSLEITFIYSLAFQNSAPQPWNLRHWSTLISTLPLRKRWDKRLTSMANPTLRRADLCSLHERNRTVCTIPHTTAPQTPLASQPVQVRSSSCSCWKTYSVKTSKDFLLLKREISHKTLNTAIQKTPLCCFFNCLPDVS